MSEAKRNMSDEHRKRISEAAKNRIRKPHSEETKEKIRLASKGKHYSPLSEFKQGHKYNQHLIVKNDG